MPSTQSLAPALALTLALASSACNDHASASVASENLTGKDKDAFCESASDASGLSLHCSNGVAVRIASADLAQFRGSAGPTGSAGAQGVPGQAAPPSPSGTPALRLFDASGAQIGDALIAPPSSLSGATVWDRANALAVSYDTSGRVTGTNAFFDSANCSGVAFAPNNFPAGSVLRVGSDLFEVTQTLSNAVKHSNSNGSVCSVATTNPGFAWSALRAYANANVPAALTLPLSVRAN